MRLIFIILVICFWVMSCEEYYPPNIDEQTPFLVFEGEITDQDTMQTIKISKSVGFNDNAYFEMVSGFHVNIEDKDGSFVSLVETSPGYYRTEEKFKGINSHEYRLVAYDAEGKLYVSTYQRLLPQDTISSVSGEYYTETQLVKTRNSSYYEETIEGIKVMVTSVSSDSTAYYRYEYDAVFQTKQCYTKEGPYPLYLFIAQPSSSLNYGTLAVANGNNYADGIIWKFPIESFKEERMISHFAVDSLEYDAAADTFRYKSDEIPREGYGMLLRVKQRSLSKDGYAFWNGLEKQLNASGTLFDPIESQIVGNIVCVDDSSEMVFGYFGASSVEIIERHLAKRFDNQVLTKPIKYFPYLPEPIFNKLKFDFWVDK